MPEELNCQGECSWGFVTNSALPGYWNFLEENTTCSFYCSCSPPEVVGDFDGQVVFTPCQQPTEYSMRLGETNEEYINRLRSISQ